MDHIGQCMVMRSTLMKSSSKWDFKTIIRKGKDYNKLMPTMRVSVEFGFGKIVWQLAFLNFRKTPKQYLSPLKEMFYVADFFVNCHRCLRGENQISYIFGCYVPTLQEYLY